MGETMELFEAIGSRRSIRKYRPEPVARDVLQRLVQVIQHSPMASNGQELRLVVVTDPDCIRAIRRFAPGLSGNPAAVLVLAADKEVAHARGGTDGREAAVYINAGVALAYLLLAAHGLGLGACPVRSFHPGALRTLVDLPQAVEPIMLMSVGYPAESPRPKTVPALDEVVFYERYGQQASASAGCGA